MDLVRCKSCDGVYSADVLIPTIGGHYYCEACLRKNINEDRFYKFATDHDHELDLLEDFFFTRVFHIKTPASGSADLRAWLRDLYKRMTAEDMLLGKGTFREKIQDYVLSDASRTESFAAWLDNYRSEITRLTGVRWPR